MSKSGKVGYLKRLLNYLVKHEWLVILLFLIFILRIPSLYEPHWYGDEEIYLVMGQGLRKGLVFYRDIFDHKPPVIYVVAAIVQNVFWFRLLLMIVHGISVVYFAKLSELLLKKKWNVILSTSVYALLSTLPFLEGNIANGENFMTVPALIGMYLIYKSEKKNAEVKTASFFLIGVLFSIAFLTKVPIIFDFLAAGMFWWIFAQKKLTLKNTFKRFFSKKLWLTVLGFFVPILLSVVYYYIKGAMEPYVRSALLQNIGYVQSWRGGEAETSMLSNPLVWRFLVIAGLISVFLMFKKYKCVSNKTLLVSVWLLMATYGSLLSNRPYPHYLLQPLIPAVLLLGLLIDRLTRKKGKDIFTILSTISVVTIFLIEVGFWSYPTIPYYKNFISFASGKISRQDHDNFFPSALERNTKIATYLRQRTSADEKVFVWGEEPAIYDLADRVPVGKYIVSFHIRDFPSGYDDTYEALTSYMPPYIVVIPSQVPSFPRLEALMQTNYIKVEEIDDAVIYKLIKR
jgi:hypothetical protein